MFGLWVILALFAIAQALNPYEVLGISQDADERTIKTAYRQLSKKYHPDKNPLEEAHEKFIEIGEAYEILNDPKKKSNYDQFGDPEGRGGGGEFDFGDIINQFFGGQGGGPGRGHPRGKPRGGDTQVNLRVSLQDFYVGKDVDFDVEMTNICDTCEGTGSKDKKKHQCQKCQGQGFVTMRRQFGPGMVQTVQMHCDECGGSGSSVHEKCGVCHGRGTRPGNRHYNVYVKPGFSRNHRVVLDGEGDQDPEKVPGNLLVQLQEDLSASWGYRRIGNNLYRTEALTLKEATQGGWERTVAFFDDMEPEIHLSRPKGSIVVSGEVEVISGKGMPILEQDDNHEWHHDDVYGDLFVEYKVIGLEADAIKDEL